MAKDYKKLGESIVSKLGGKDNVSKLLHCATRLRFTLKDKSKADLDGVKNIAGVMGAVSAPDGIQVIIGNDVSKVYDTSLFSLPVRHVPSADSPCPLIPVKRP